jgi:hypothetical protein
VSRRLAYEVVVLDEAGAAQTFARHSIPPEWAAVQITNPSCWTEDVDEASVQQAAAAPAEPSAKASGQDGAEVPAGNASTEHWAAYAAAVGVDVPEDAKRDDIKGLLRDRGLLESMQ